MGAAASVQDSLPDDKLTTEEKEYVKNFIQERATGRSLTIEEIKSEYDEALLKMRSIKDNIHTKSPMKSSLKSPLKSPKSPHPRVMMKQPSARITLITKHTDDHANFLSSLDTAKPNHEFEEGTEVHHETHAAVNDFISKMADGGNGTVPSSEFRARRLSMNKKFVTQPKAKIENHIQEKSSTTTSNPSVLYASHEIGASEEFPIPSQYFGSFSCHGIEPADYGYGIHEKINQDRGCVVYPFNHSDADLLFLVLDGHGEFGDHVAEFAMQQIVVTLEKEPLLTTDPKAALTKTFISTNTSLTRRLPPNEYLSSGCTCVCIYMTGNTLWIASVGDSRAVCASDIQGNIIANPLTRDHKPDDPEEKDRIVKHGGFVSPPPEPGLSARVWLDPQCTMIGLAMARSLGDFVVKKVGVTAEPEVKKYDLQVNDKFMILGSDGIWEFIESQEAVEIVSRHLEKGANVACQELIKEAAKRWQKEEGDYRDDITALVVTFPIQAIPSSDLLPPEPPHLPSEPSMA